MKKQKKKVNIVQQTLPVFCPQNFIFGKNGRI